MHLSDADKQHITGHLHEYGVLKHDQNIVADTHTAPPAITCHIVEELAALYRRAGHQRHQSTSRKSGSMAIAD